MRCTCSTHSSPAFIRALFHFRFCSSDSVTVRSPHPPGDSRHWVLARKKQSNCQDSNDEKKQGRSEQQQLKECRPSSAENECGVCSETEATESSAATCPAHIKSLKVSMHPAFVSRQVLQKRAVAPTPPPTGTTPKPRRCSLHRSRLCRHSK